MSVLCVTPNPSVDRVGLVSRVTTGSIHRPHRMQVSAGGKGVNVARVVAELDGKATASVLLAGHSGRWMAEAMRQDGITCLAAWAEGETRSCLSVLDEATGLWTEFYEPGLQVSKSEWAAFEDQTLDTVAASSAVTLSGSLPGGAPASAYASLTHAAREAAVPCLVDTTGEPLGRAMAEEPDLVKLNAAEAASWSGQAVETPAQALVAAGRLVEAGARMAVVTLGKQGAVMMAGTQAWLAEAPSVSGNGSVGSGDAMLAGLALGLASQAAAEDALRLGMAAGAANMMHLGAGQVRRHDVDRLLPRVKLSQRAG